MASILVVDDEPDIRYLTQVNLEMDGHRVMTAANGRDALAAVNVEAPDLVLLDVMMPDVDGWEVLETIKSSIDPSVKTVRVLMMTALGTDDDRLRGGIEGAVRYLVKPVDAQLLRTTVDEVLTGESEPDQRRAAQTGALSELARREKGVTADPEDLRQPRLSRLEHARPRQDQDDVAEAPLSIGSQLTDKQRTLLATLTETSSVSQAATELGVSRSNVYASLRRVARKLEIDSVPELLRRLRGGQIVFDGD